MTDIYGTWGPSCKDGEVLKEMFMAGMTGIRVNLSHVKLSDITDEIEIIKNSAGKACELRKDKGSNDKIPPVLEPKILIDMQGPELRIGSLKSPLKLSEGDVALLTGEGSELSGRVTNGKESADMTAGIPLDEHIIGHMHSGMEVLIDDGRILGRVTDNDDGSAYIKIIRGGVLRSRKSIALVGESVDMPAITKTDIENIKTASGLGITAVMQPFVRSASDLKEVRKALDENGCKDIKIFAKIENMEGVNKLESLLDNCDEIVVARGDLGNSMPLWKLPGVQKYISEICRNRNKPFMVVTQMLASMEHSKVPTRAEVSDIYNAVMDGASSVMVTGETAVGDYPVEVIKYLKNTAMEAEKDKSSFGE